MHIEEKAIMWGSQISLWFFFWSGWSENVGDWGLGNLLQCDHESGRSPRQGIQNPGMEQS